MRIFRFYFRIRPVRVGGCFEFFEGVSVCDGEFRDGGAAQGFQMRAAAEFLAHFMGYGAHVSAGGYASAKAGAGAFDAEDFKFLDLDLHRLQYDFFFLRASL